MNYLSLESRIHSHKGFDIHFWAKNKGFEYFTNSYGPKLIVFGERHFDNDLINAQAELIDFLKPEYVLHEFQGSTVYDSSLYQTAVDDGKNEEITFFRLLSQQNSFQLVGIDASPDEAFSIRYDSVEDIHRYREMIMARNMIKYVRSSEKPVIAIVGAYHSHPSSPLHDVLNSERIPYCVIQQSEIKR